MTIVPSRLVVWLLQLMMLQDAVCSETACGQPVISPRIVGGQPASDGSWPWQVSFYENGEHFCGGSLITNEWVVSAAHCFYSSSTNNYEVLLGAYQLLNPSSNVVTSGVQQIILNSAYDGRDGSSGDIALVKLASPVNFTDYILPACLPKASVQLSSESDCWVTGWGFTQEEEKLGPPKTLQELQVPIIDQNTCNALFNINPSADLGMDPIQPDMICAGYEDGGKDACYLRSCIAIATQPNIQATTSEE